MRDLRRKIKGQPCHIRLNISGKNNDWPQLSTKNCPKMVNRSFSFKPVFTFWRLDLNI